MGEEFNKVFGKVCTKVRQENPTSRKELLLQEIFRYQAKRYLRFDDFSK